MLSLFVIRLNSPVTSEDRPVSVRGSEEGELTLNEPGSPDPIIQTDLVPPEQPQAFERFPLRGDNFTTKKKRNNFAINYDKRLCYLLSQDLQICSKVLYAICYYHWNQGQSSHPSHLLFTIDRDNHLQNYKKQVTSMGLKSSITDKICSFLYISCTINAVGKCWSLPNGLEHWNYVSHCWLWHNHLGPAQSENLIHQWSCFLPLAFLVSFSTSDGERGPLSAQCSLSC